MFPTSFVKGLPIKNIIGVYSIKSVIIEDVVGYYDNSSVIREIVTFQTYHNYPIGLFYLGCVAVSGLLLYDKLNNKKETKLKKLTEYKDITRCVNVFIIIFTMLFTKNIENAI